MSDVTVIPSSVLDPATSVKPVLRSVATNYLVDVEASLAIGCAAASEVVQEEWNHHRIGQVDEEGADLIVDMTDTDYARTVRDCSGSAGANVVIDNLGGASLAQSLHAVRPLGIVVLMGNVLGLESTLQVRDLFSSEGRSAIL